MKPVLSGSTTSGKESDWHADAEGADDYNGFYNYLWDSVDKRCMPINSAAHYHEINELLFKLNIT